MLDCLSVSRTRLVRGARPPPEAPHALSEMPPMPPRDDPSSHARRIISVDELKKHTTANDGWVCIKDKVRAPPPRRAPASPRRRE
jgi:hypothetical protein